MNTKSDEIATDTSPGERGGKVEQTLRMVAGMFEESSHETYTREEVVSIVEDMIGIATPAQPEPVAQRGSAICCNCDKPLSCGACGVEVPDDSKEWEKLESETDVAVKALEEAQHLLDRADSCIRTDAAGNRFRSVFSDDLDALSTALSIEHLSRMTLHYEADKRTCLDAKAEIERLSKQLVCVRSETIKECEKIAREMTHKHGNPTGDLYTCGVWDQGVRIAGKLLALTVTDEHEPGCQSGDFGPCDCKLSDEQGTSK